ncbi:hypothetical protein OXX59_000612 [Metschnikowia pulcherrima]
MKLTVLSVTLAAEYVTCSSMKETANMSTNTLTMTGDRPSSRATVFLVCSVVLLSFLVIVVYTFKYRRERSREALQVEEDNQAYLDLNSDEQELYFQSKDFLGANPYLTGDLTLSQNLFIQEKGIHAWEFLKDPMLTNNDLLIIQKHELNFFKKFECSAQTNLPIPNMNEIYYFESKIFTLPKPEETTISIGISVKPYPWFRLPGRHSHSVSYDSDGRRRHNQPFPILTGTHFPKLLEGDVVGIGYKVRSGTIFFTRNGKKLSESKLGGHIKSFKMQDKGQLYPTVGANNLCSVHVNVGQMGFVFIEGNVKKWGFAPLQGTGPAPPAYNKFNVDVLLERSEIDEENGTSERDNDFPPDFLEFQPKADEPSRHNDAFRILQSEDQITMCSLPPNSPPRYEHPSSDFETTIMGQSFEIDSNTEMYRWEDSAQRNEGQSASETGGHRAAVTTAEACDASTQA